MKKQLHFDAMHRTMKMFIALLFTCLLAVGSAWGQTSPVYTLSFTQNSSNTAYASYYDVTCSNITWSVPGNQGSGDYVKIGGKIESATRYLYSKGYIPYNIESITLSHGTKDQQITVNSLTLTVYSSATDAATGSNPVSTITGTYTASGTTTFTKPDNANWNNRYYRITYNLSSSAPKSNKGLILNNVSFFQVPPTIHTVTLHEGTSTTTLTESSIGAGVTLPSVTVSCPDFTFAGWSPTNNNIISTSLIAPGEFTPNDDYDLYAVFATPSGSNVPAILSTSVDNPSTDWTVSESHSSNDYWRICKDNFIATPDLDLSTITSIDIYMGTYGTTSTANNTLIVSNNGQTWQTKLATTNKENTLYTLSADDGAFELSGTGFLTFTINGSSTSDGLRISAITINYGVPGYTYSTTVPTCSNQVATPTFSPEAGTYNSAQNITISCATEGASISYAVVQGTAEPQYSSYESPISLSQRGTYTVYAKAVRDGMDDSEVATASYTINLPYSITAQAWGTGGTVTASASSATTGTEITITITPDNGYELDELMVVDNEMTDIDHTPGATANTFVFTMPSAPVSIIATFKQSTAYTVTVNQDIEHGTVTATPTSAYAGDTITVTVTPDNYYSFGQLYVMNGNNAIPTTASQTTNVYTFTMPAANVSVSATFTADQVATPVITPASGSYDVDQTVTIACTTQGATIRYTLDGTEPTENATEYTQSITISESATLKAKAFMQGHPASEIASASYVLPTAVADIAAFKAAVAQNTSTTIRYRINGDLVVTAVNGGQVFVQDNSGQLQSNGLLLYASGNNLQIGDVINNVVGNYATYQGNTEFVPLTTPTATSTGNPTAITVTTTDLLANPTLYMHNLIKVENIHFDATNTYVTSASGTATPLKETTDLAINNNFKGLNITLKKDARADVIGITMQYTNDNGAIRLQPRNNDDIYLRTVYHEPDDVIVCDTYTWKLTENGNNQTYTQSGTYTNTIVNELTDDVYAIDLTVNHATTKTINQEACVTYTWTDGNGQTYTESGDYNYTTVNANGCDSIVTLHLTIFPNPDITLTLNPDRSTICVGEEVEMSLDGISEGEILLEEDFSSCTGSSSNEISGLSTFPTKSKAYNNSGSVKLGSNGSVGSITSKSLDLSSPFTVTITAEAYSSSEAGPLKVTVGDVTKSIPSLATTSTEYTLNFDAATATSKVKIATTNSAKRAILNAVVISTTGDNVVWSTQATTESITVAPTAAGSYTYSATVTDEHNCSSTVEQELTVLPHPTAVIVGNAKDTICGGATKTFTVQDANENLFSYQWYKDNVAIEGATSSTYTLTNAEGTQSGSYTVVASNIACSETSEPVALLVNAPGAPDYAFTITPNANDIYDTIYIGYCDVNHEFVEPTATHYLAGTSWAEVTFSTDAATTYDTPGDYTINWTGTDACGNTATCSQTLHIAIEACPNAQDYEGNTYASVRINCECWTTSDLKSTKYSDGSDIEGAMEYTSETFPNADDNVATYGRLYDWNSTVAKDNATLNTPNARGHIQGICPEGWYLPTNDQFMALAGYSTTTNLNNCRANQYWLDGGGNNSTGLTLLPAGCYNSSTERFENILGNNYYWNAYEYDETSAKTYVADCNCYMFTITNSNKGMGYSVRCIKERTR